MATFQKVTAVFDRSTIDLEALQIRLGLPVDPLDTKTAAMLNAAKRAADSYMNNPFVELDADTLTPTSDPPVELDIPEDVDEGVIATVEARLAWAPFGITEDKVGDLQRKYARYATSSDALKDIKATFWRPYKRMIGGAVSAYNPNL